MWPFVWGLVLGIVTIALAQIGTPLSWGVLVLIWLVMMTVHFHLAWKVLRD